jgi:hypothetical protein
MTITPKKENEKVGFKYHVTMEQMLEQQKKTPEEIFQWLEEHAAFLAAFQTEEDKERMRKMKNKKTTLD